MSDKKIIFNKEIDGPITIDKGIKEIKRKYILLTFLVSTLFKSYKYLKSQ